MIAVYDLKENEQCIAVFDRNKECQEWLGITSQRLSNILYRKQVFKDRYEIVKIQAGD